MIIIMDIFKKYWCERGHFNEDQFVFMNNLVVEKKPKYCLETGFCTGRSALSVLYGNNWTEKFINIDINYDYFREGRVMLKKFQERWKIFKGIESSSRVILTKDFLNYEYPNGIDWFTVDGDHTYEGCYNDIEKVIPHMNQGGIIIIDDYKSGPPNGCSLPAVTKACDDIYIKYEKILNRRSWNKNGKGFCIFTIDISKQQ